MSDERSLTLVCVGDISLQVGDEEKKTPPFVYMKDILSEGDLVFGNLETVISTRGKQQEKSVVFRCSPDKIRYLKEAGFNILNLANNHILDYGLEGLRDSVQSLKAENIDVVGIRINGNSNPVVKTIRGVRLAFLGYTDVGTTDDRFGPTALTQKDSCRDIDLLRRSTDIIIVSVHWGEEFVLFPSSRQQEIARRMIDNGANLVVGHHPHVVQGIEKYRHGIILYSIGNFNVIDREISEFASGGNGLVLRCSVTIDGIKQFDFVPIKLNESSQPVIISPEEKPNFLRLVEKISLPLQCRRISPVFWYAEASHVYLPLQIKAFLFRIKTYGIRHLRHFVKWLVSPYTIKMYLGWLWKSVRN